ncbi:MAG: GAF domain-containing protein [Bacteroidota bacterium]
MRNQWEAFIIVVKLKGLEIALYFLGILILVSGGVYYYLDFIQEKNQNANQDFITVRFYSNELIETLHLLDLGVRGYYMVPEDNLLEPYQLAFGRYKTAKDSLNHYIQKYEFDQQVLKKIDVAMKDYMATVTEMVKLKKQGRDDELLSIFKKDPGYQFWIEFSPSFYAIQTYFDDLQQANYASFKKLNRISLFLRVGLLAFGLPTIYFVLMRFARNQQRIRSFFNDIKVSNQDYIFNNGKKDESLKENTIVNELRDNLKGAKEIINSLTQSDYNVQWDGLSDENVKLNEEGISGALMKMRDQMKKVKEDDKRRIWHNDGISSISKIIRLNQDSFEQLCRKALKEIVDYSNSNQGGIFLVEDRDGSEEKILELKSSYAYGRDKFAEKALEPGQGLVGQCYLEKEYIYLQDIPSDYVNITSGLGKATPKELLIVPMLINEEVHGIIELASFNKFESHHIDFMNEIGTIMASSLVSLKTSLTTKKLLEQSQEQAEQMRSQEEEMRQNMEELQATQEEAHRKTMELEKVIEHQQKEIAELSEDD